MSEKKMLQCGPEAITPRMKLRVLNVVRRERIVSGLRQTPRTDSAVREVGKYHAHLSRQSTARFQLIRVFKIIEICVRNETLRFHDYL